MIEVSGLTKSFGDIRAVVDVDFAVGEGEFFGFLGPNGAGKTTTINMLTGLARPDAGVIRIGGIDCSRDPKAAQHLVGIVPDDSNLYPELTGFDNLSFCGALYGLRRVEREARARQLLETFDLVKAGSRKFAGYSRGMKRKLTLAAGLIHEPRILFLDEPTTGIDVASARQIRTLLAGLRRAGTTVFLTTHYIEEAERLCDRIAFIVGGRIVRIDTVDNLMRPVSGKHVVSLVVSGSGETLGPALAQSFPALSFQTVSDRQILAEASEPVRVGPLVRFIEDRGGEVLEARRRQPSLEDVFVQVTGIQADLMHKEKDKAGRAS